MPRTVRSIVKDSSLVEERRALIIDTAIRLFARKGYHKTSTTEIAEACGMSPGSLYRYIGSKEDISHLLVQRSRGEAEKLRQWLDQTNSDDVVATLCGLVADRVSFQEERRHSVRFLTSQDGFLSPEDATAMREDHDENARAVERLLLKGAESGVFRVEHSFWTAHLVLWMIMFWAQRRRVLKEHFTREDCIRLCTDSILDMVLVSRHDESGVEVASARGQEPALQDAASS